MKIGGYFAFLSIQQTIFREEAKERILNLLPDSKLTKLSFSEIQFGKIDWVDGNKELYFEGKLYDVVRFETSGSNYILFCVDDENDTEVYTEILQISKMKLDELPVKNTMISFLNLLNLKYTIPQILSFENQPILKLGKPFFASLPINFLSVRLPILSPPPKS